MKKAHEHRNGRDYRAWCRLAVILDVYSSGAKVAVSTASSSLDPLSHALGIEGLQDAQVGFGPCTASAIPPSKQCCSICFATMSVVHQFVMERKTWITPRIALLRLAPTGRVVHHITW